MTHTRKRVGYRQETDDERKEAEGRVRKGRSQTGGKHRERVVVEVSIGEGTGRMSGSFPSEVERHSPLRHNHGS